MTQDAKWREKIQNQDWSETGLKDYLFYDNWDEHSACCVLAGFYFPQKPKSIGDMLLDSKNESDFKIKGRENIQTQLEIGLFRLKAFSKYSNKVREFGSPSSYIEWALSKEFRPLWLDWAIEHNLYVPKQGLNSGQLDTTDTIETYTFDPKSTIYPNELELACQAWRAVSSTKGKGTPKERITKWLKDNTDLSNSAIGRISIVANWKKVGGVT
jgi:hypothetical protein